MLKDIKARFDIFNKELEIIKRDMTILRRIKNFGTRIPGGTVNKNSTANAGDMGSISALGRLHMPQSN